MASSLLNAGLQVGGSIGLAVLGTVAWTVVAHSLQSQAAAATARAARPSQAAVTAAYHHALAGGFSRAFLGGAVIMLLALVITVVAIRIRRADLAGAPGPADEPGLAAASTVVAADSRP